MGAAFFSGNLARSCGAIRRRQLKSVAMAVIQVQGLSKSFRTYKKQPGFSGALKGLFHRQYETVFAVKEVSFQVGEGELVGFLGPNGAGKTTTLKMLAGLLYPTTGAASVLGYTPWKRDDGYRRHLVTPPFGPMRRSPSTVWCPRSVCTRTTEE